MQAMLLNPNQLNNRLTIHSNTSLYKVSEYSQHLWSVTRVTRLGDFLLLGQPFKAGGNYYFTQIAHIVGPFL